MSDKALTCSKFNETAAASELENAAVIFSYWLRTIISAGNASFDDLFAIVLKYYLIMKLEWDSAEIIDERTLSDDGKRINLIPEEDGISLRSKDILSAVNVSTVSWEMTLVQAKLCVSLFMGYIDADHVADFNGNDSVGTNAHEVAYWVNECSYPKTITNDKITELHEKWKFGPKVGDKFRLEFDFNEKECNAFYNGELMGSITTALPPEIYLAVSIFYGGSSYETTLFEVSHTLTSKFNSTI